VATIAEEATCNQAEVKGPVSGSRRGEMGRDGVAGGTNTRSRAHTRVRRSTTIHELAIAGAWKARGA
jgi:hypothetical protein